jgi:hypothetical protein
MLEDRELLLRILADTRPAGIVEGAYLFAQTEPNQESVFRAGKWLLDQGHAARLLISDCGPKSGYAGAAVCRQAMLEYGIPGQAVEEVPMEPTEILHTLLESQKLVRFARARGYKRLIVVSAPFHQQRAFMTVVTTMLREYPCLKVYSHPGESQPWDKLVTHSQGKLRGTRAEMIAQEHQRIENYTAQGDLAPRASILKYLSNRDDI